MRKLFILLTLLLSLTCCKGRRTGPLETINFDKQESKPAMSSQKSPGPAQPDKIEITIEPGEGCIKLADLFSNKKDYSEKIIKVKGYVIKYSPQIMGKNWVHIQDGSEFEGMYDLTVTTNQPVELGETVIFEGKFTLDKDFGYGYFYPVLLEDGKIIE